MHSLQDKLGFAFTSAGSQRKLAALVGVSHQKIGRWLKGDSSVPPEYSGAINQAFAIHKDITRAQARADEIDYDPRLPIYAKKPVYERTKQVKRVIKSTGEIKSKTVKTGVMEKGTRIFTGDTRFIPQPLLGAWIQTQYLTGKLFQVSVGSVIDLKKYRGAVSPTREELNEDKPALYQWQTQYENAQPGHPNFLNGIWNKLDKQYAAAQGTKGEAFANQVILQLKSTPSNNGPQSQTKKSSRKDYKRTKNRRR